MPTVSVVIPTYNRAEYLPRAIDSVLDQTFSDFELVVVDDASTDETSQIIREYTDGRLGYIQFDENAGANAARNAGIRAAAGEFISFLDSDDAFRQRNLELTTDRLQRASSECAGVFTSHTYIQGGEIVNVSDAPEGEISYEGMRENPIGGFSAVMLRSSVLDDVGMLDENLVSHQDIDLFLRILRHQTMIGIDEILVDYYIHGERISSDPERRLRGQEQFLQKHEGDLPSLMMGRIHYARALKHAHLSELRTAQREFLRAIRVNPNKLRYYYHLGATLFGMRGFKISIDIKQRLNLFRRRLDKRFR
jgi:glycosyltransferase involved in cell wall biosynthesis